MLCALNPSAVTWLSTKVLTCSPLFIPANTPKKKLQRCNPTSELEQTNEKYSWEISWTNLSKCLYEELVISCFQGVLATFCPAGCSKRINQSATLLHAAEKLPLRTKAQSPDPKPKQVNAQHLICMSVLCLRTAEVWLSEIKNIFNYQNKFKLIKNIYKHLLIKVSGVRLRNRLLHAANTLQ